MLNDNSIADLVSVIGVNASVELAWSRNAASLNSTSLNRGNIWKICLTAVTFIAH